MNKKKGNIFKKIKIKYIIIFVIVAALAYGLWSCFNMRSNQPAVGMMPGMGDVVML